MLFAMSGLALELSSAKINKDGAPRGLVKVTLTKAHRPGIALRQLAVVEGIVRPK